MTTLLETEQKIKELRATAKLKLAERQLSLLEDTDTWKLGKGLQIRAGSHLRQGASPDIYQDRTKSIRTIAELNLAQNLSQDLVETNPNAGGALRMLARHVVGTGSDWTVISNDSEAEPPPVLAKKASGVLKAFCAKNYWRDLEFEMVVRLHTHGEFFLEVIPDEDDSDEYYMPDFVTRVAFIEPQNIVPPLDYEINTDDVWSFGILTKENSPRPIAYNVRNFRTNRERRIPAQFVIHKKVNAWTNAKRGIPTFYSCDDDIRGAAKTRWAEREGGIVRALIAYIRLFREGVQKSALTALADEEATDFISPTGDDFVGDTVRGQVLGGPSVISTSAEKVEGPPSNPNAASSGQNVDQGLQAAAAALGVPEWVVSGKADVSSYAGSLQTGSPFLLTIDDNQATVTCATVETFTKVLEIAVEQEQIPSSVLEELEVSVRYPDNTVRNKKEELDGELELYDRVLLDGDSVRTSQGFDPEHVKAKIKEEGARTPNPQPKISLSQTAGAAYKREK
jgi:hypothetical protein